MPYLFLAFNLDDLPSSTHALREHIQRIYKATISDLIFHECTGHVFSCCRLPPGTPFNLAPNQLFYYFDWDHRYTYSDFISFVNRNIYHCTCKATLRHLYIGNYLLRNNNSIKNHML